MSQSQFHNLSVWIHCCLVLYMQLWLTLNDAYSCIVRYTTILFSFSSMTLPLIKLLAHTRCCIRNINSLKVQPGLLLLTSIILWILTPWLIVLGATVLLKLLVTTITQQRKHFCFHQYMYHVPCSALFCRNKLIQLDQNNMVAWCLEGVFWVIKVKGSIFSCDVWGCQLA